MKSILVLSLLVDVAGSGSRLMAQSPGKFTPTGDMGRERMAHTATLLTNGKVLIAGGSAIISFSLSASASAELYDPAAGTFTATGAMTTSRFRHSATLLPNGKVLLAGGSRNGAPNEVLATAELYDPSTGTFTPTGPMTKPRQSHAAILLNTGKVLITGGAPGPDRSAELYDSITGTFTSTGDMAAAREGHVSVVLPNGRVFIEGGGSCDVQPNPELYDPVSGQFTLTGPSAYLSQGLSARSASLLPNGNVLATLDVGCDVSSGAEVYDSLKGTFAVTANMTTGRGYNTSTLLPEGKVLIEGRDWARIGGSAEIYDPVTGAFTAVGGTFPQREEYHRATLLPNGTVLLTGGWICCGYSVATAEIYHPAVLTPSPVLFSLSGDGKGPGAILHSGTHQVVSPGDPAVAGEALEIYLTGLTEGSLIPPQLAIGGRMAEVLFFGKAPGFACLNQVNVRVPSGIAPGPAVPVRLNYLARSSNEVTIGVQ